MWHQFQECKFAAILTKSTYSTLLIQNLKRKCTRGAEKYFKKIRHYNCQSRNNLACNLINKIIKTGSKY